MEKIEYKGYMVHSDGRIEKKNRNGFLSFSKDASGYKMFVQSNGRKSQVTTRVHKFIWEAFNGKIPDGFEVDHIDEDRSNNKLSNLRLLTKQQNISRAKRKLSNKEIQTVFYLKSLGWRQVDIAEELGCTQPLVSQILNGKSYIWNF